MLKVNIAIRQPLSRTSAWQQSDRGSAQLKSCSERVTLQRDVTWWYFLKPHLRSWLGSFQSSDSDESIRELNEKHLCWTYFWVFVLIGGLDRKQEVAGYLVVSILSIQCVCFYGITKYFPIYVNTFWFWRSSGYEQFELTANRKLT